MWSLRMYLTKVVFKNVLDEGGLLERAWRMWSLRMYLTKVVFKNVPDEGGL